MGKIVPLILSLLLWMGACTKESFPLVDVRCVTDEKVDWLIPHGEFPKPTIHKSTGPITIPVVVHLVYNTPVQNISQAQIESQIVALNQDFTKTNSDTNLSYSLKRNAGKMNIHFCLDTVIRKYSLTTSWSANGAVKLTSMGGDDAWDCNRWLNIWVCNTAGYLGYATYPGGNPIADGIVVKYSAFGTTGTLLPLYAKGRTATHETGHWLNAHHTFWPNCGSDLCSDTPPQNTPNYTCPSFPKSDSCSSSVMFMNYMDYSPDGCMCMFTNVQCKNMTGSVYRFRPSFINAVCI